MAGAFADSLKGDIVVIITQIINKEMIENLGYLEFLDNNKDLFPIIEKLASKYTVEEANLAFADAKKNKNIKTLLVKDIK